MKKVLIIEDDQRVARIYLMHLDWAGYSVECASNGKSGLNALARMKPDLVLLDMSLPDMNSVVLLKEIHQRTAPQPIPVIVFTNPYAPASAKEAKKAGAQACLDKAQTSAPKFLKAVALALAEAALQPAGTAASATAASSGKPLPVDSRAEFSEGAGATAKTLQAYSRELLQLPGVEAQVKMLEKIRQTTHELIARAGMAESTTLARLASALEALLQELCVRTGDINASTLRTVFQTVSLLASLLELDRLPLDEKVLSPTVLAVDDDEICLRAVSSALEKAQLPCTTVNDSRTAYDGLKKTRYDLIILDVNMPGMDGFELSEKLRNFSINRNTPILFVTILDGFESRMRSAQVGGTDFIAKPFVPLELAVKALNLSLQARLSLTRPVFQSFT